MKERKPIIERDGESKKLYGKRRHEKRERNSGERERAHQCKENPLL